MFILEAVPLFCAAVVELKALLGTRLGSRHRNPPAGPQPATPATARKSTSFWPPSHGVLGLSSTRVTSHLRWAGTAAAAARSF